MQIDFGLPVIKEDELERLTDTINKKLQLNIRIPLTEIDMWKKQFLNLGNVIL